MKKISIITLVLITVFLTGFCFFCSAQTKSKGDSNIKDSVKAVIKIDTVYNMALNPSELGFVIYLLTLQDEKPSIIKVQKDYLIGRTKAFLLRPTDSIDIKIMPKIKK